MTAFTALWVILGIFMGLLIAYWFIMRKKKKIINNAVSLLNQFGNIPGINPLIDTLKSEGGAVHENLPKKEEEKPSVSPEAKDEGITLPSSSEILEELKDEND